MKWLRLAWPFITRGLHLIETQHRDAQIERLEAEVKYWQARAERLMDAALARAGAIHEPTMVDRKVSPHMNPAAVLAGAMSITEIDSSKAKGKA